jgi:hypothetical protein
LKAELKTKTTFEEEVKTKITFEIKQGMIIDFSSQMQNDEHF